jgi:hypothetical protein
MFSHSVYIITKIMTRREMRLPSFTKCLFMFRAKAPYVCVADAVRIMKNYLRLIYTVRRFIADQIAHSSPTPLK